MIGEAIDTLFTLGWALAVWLVLLATVATVVLYTLAVTAAWACRAVRRGVAAVVALAQHIETPAPLPAPHKPPHARLARTRPTWAQPDKEAA